MNIRGEGVRGPLVSPLLYFHFGHKRAGLTARDVGAVIGRDFVFEGMRGRVETAPPRRRRFNV